MSQCDPATKFADPPGVLTTMCTIREFTGTEGLLGSKASTSTAILHVKGNGKVSLQETAP
jgi:hypothetical protein